MIQNKNPDLTPVKLLPQNMKSTLVSYWLQHFYKRWHCGTTRCINLCLPWLLVYTSYCFSQLTEYVRNRRERLCPVVCHAAPSTVAVGLVRHIQIQSDVCSFVWILKHHLSFYSTSTVWRSFASSVQKLYGLELYNNFRQFFLTSTHRLDAVFILYHRSALALRQLKLLFLLLDSWFLLLDVFGW